MFELNRGRFYRSLEKTPEIQPINIKDEDLTDFWSKMWTKEGTVNDNKQSEKLEAFLGFGNRFTDEEEKFDISEDDFEHLIGTLPNWKASGPDKIYNFYIKRFTALHKILRLEIIKIINNEYTPTGDFYKGLTFLIPKDVVKEAKHFRPITCLSNLFKLTTKLINQSLQVKIERGDMLSHNQLGTRRRCQGAKEQALINKSLNECTDNKLKTAWLDVKKAFDSIPHHVLIRILKSFNTPTFIVRFLENALEN